MTTSHPSPAEASQPLEVDLLVIGAGPGGEKGAAQAAYAGKRVALVERSPKPGGAAVNSGTIPSKALRETALYFSGLKQRGFYGVDYHVKADITLPEFMFRERMVVEAQWVQIAENLDKHGIVGLQGTARFVAPGLVEVRRYGEAPRRIHAQTVLIATGSRPHRPAQIPFDDEVIVDVDTILQLSRIPPRLVVVAGDPTGIELAAIFAALGSNVTIVSRDARLVPALDAEVSEVLRAELTRRLGVGTLLGVEVVGVTRTAETAHVQLADGSVVHGDCVLWCGRRRGNTDALQLDAIGMSADAHGFLAVDEHFRTAAAGVYAAGDVTGHPAAAATAMEQGRLAMCHAFQLGYKQRLASALPSVLWTIPEVAMVGETEETLRSRGRVYETGKAYFSRNARGQILGDDGFVKLIFDPQSQRLLGASLVGEGACELIHVATTAMSFDGTLDTFIQGVYAYPTLAEAYKYAAYDGLQRLARRVARQSGLGRLTPTAPPEGPASA